MSSSLFFMTENNHLTKFPYCNVVLFAENPNFRGTAYGTNRLFLNALFLGSHIGVPREQIIAWDEQ